MAPQIEALRSTRLYALLTSTELPLHACQEHKAASEKAGMFLRLSQCRGEDELPDGFLTRDEEAVRLGSASRKRSFCLGCQQGAEVGSRVAGKVLVAAAAAEEGATASRAKAMRTTRHPCEHPANPWTASLQVLYSPLASLEVTHIHASRKCTSQGCIDCWRLLCSTMHSRPSSSWHAGLLHRH